MNTRNRLHSFVFAEIVSVIIAIAVFLACSIRSELNVIYNDGVQLLKENKYEEAVEKFSEIPEYLKYRDIVELLEDYKE